MWALFQDLGWVLNFEENCRNSLGNVKDKESVYLSGFCLQKPREADTVPKAGTTEVPDKSKDREIRLKAQSALSLFQDPKSNNVRSRFAVGATGTTEDNQEL